MDVRQDTDISLREIILKLQDYFNLLWGKKVIIILISIITGIAFVALNWNAKPQYHAELTFMLNEDERGGISGLSGLLGQFGFGLSNGESNFDKILALSKSRRISQDVCFEEITIDSKNDYLANHLISTFEEFDLWENKSLLSFLGPKDSLSLIDFRFHHSDVEAFSLLENKALKKVHNIIAGSQDQKGILYPSFDEYTGIMTFFVDSPNEELSLKMVNVIYEKLSSYYVIKAIEKQKYDYEIIKSKYDSIYNRLNTVRSDLAYFEDSNKDLFRKREILQRNKLKTEEQKLLLMVGKAEEQLQLAALTLDNKTPYIQVIDKPIPPLKPMNKSVIYFLALGILVGGFLSTAYFVFRKILNEIMSS